MSRLRVLLALSLLVTLGGCVVAPGPGYYRGPAYVAPAPYYRPYYGGGYYRPHYGPRWGRW
jgi:hypothetical protein